MTSTTRATALSAPQLTPTGVLLAIAVVILLGVGLGLLVQPGAGPAGGRLPAGFPMPPGAQQTATVGETVALNVPGTAREVHAFYGAALADKGWAVEEWDGTDPYGAAATGFIIERDGQRGALSIVQNGPEVAVEINMNQPDLRTDIPGGHGAHGAPADQ